MAWRPAVKGLRRTRIGTYLATSSARPKYWLPSWRAARLLWSNYGHLQSVRLYQSVDSSGEAMPWYTYPAIEFLKQFDFSGKRVFEYGSGNSTVFWSRRAASVVSVEDEDEWVDQMRPRLPANCTLLHEPDLHRYPAVIHNYPDGFDIIIVDGPGRGWTRMKCARAALQHLRPGGLIILDNSDWVPDTATCLREADLLQIDMSGFAPIAAHTQTTSFFFHRQCRLQPHSGRQPIPSAGARLINWDQRASEAEQRLVPGPVVAIDDHTFLGVSHDEDATKASPRGPRHFRVLIYTTADGPHIAVLDVDAGRVLVLAHRPRSGDLRAEVDRLRGMTWDAFREFVRSHEYRYYILE